MSGALVRAVTYNIHGCVGTDGRYDPGRVATVLDQLDADLIGLQEVDTRHPYREGQHQFDFLRRVTRMHAVAGPNIREERGEFGNALLTRWPIESVRRSDLTHSRREPRGALDVTVKTPHGPLRAVVTHLGLRASERRRQIIRLIDALGAIGAEPTVLLGDFNDWWPGAGRQLRALTAHFAARCAVRSYPSFAPFLALDRVYAHPLPAIATAKAYANALARVASDHLPVVAELQWRRE